MKLSSLNVNTSLYLVGSTENNTDEETKHHFLCSGGGREKVHRANQVLLDCCCIFSSYCSPFLLNSWCKMAKFLNEADRASKFLHP